MLHLTGHFDSKGRFCLQSHSCAPVPPSSASLRPNRKHEIALGQLMLLHSGAAELMEPDGGERGTGWRDDRGRGKNRAGEGWGGWATGK